TIIQKLSEVDPDEIFSSPLSRCTLLAEQIGKPHRIDQRLMEMNFGEWELLPWTEIYHSAEGKKWFGNYLHEAPPGGESFQSMLRRVSAFIGEVCTDDKVRVIVTHAGTIRAFLAAMGLVAMDQAFDIPVAYGEVIKIEDNRYNYITK
ncbi:MAG: histidine phosphatase family protein, partial [Bacteroidales bacterium]